MLMLFGHQCRTTIKLMSSRVGACQPDRPTRAIPPLLDALASQTLRALPPPTAWAAPIQTTNKYKQINCKPGLRPCKARAWP